MEDTTLVESSVSATIHAPFEQVDIPSWCFSLPESEYQSCSPAHCVIWDLKVRKLDDQTCEFTNTVHSSATPELRSFSAQTFPTTSGLRRQR